MVKRAVCVQKKKKRMKIEDTEERLLKRIRRSEGIVFCDSHLISPGGPGKEQEGENPCAQPTHAHPIQHDAEPHFNFPHDQAERGASGERRHAGY